MGLEKASPGIEQYRPKERIPCPGKLSKASSSWWQTFSQLVPHLFWQFLVIRPQYLLSVPLVQFLNICRPPVLRSSAQAFYLFTHCAWPRGKTRDYFPSVTFTCHVLHHVTRAVCFYYDYDAPFYYSTNHALTGAWQWTNSILNLISWSPDTVETSFSEILCVYVHTFVWKVARKKNHWPIEKC